MRTRARHTTLLAVGCATLLGGARSFADAAAENIAIPPTAYKVTQVCTTPDKSHYVAMQKTDNGTQLWYGDGKQLTQVTKDGHFAGDSMSFVEPRYTNPTANPDFRGQDWRIMSSVEFNEDTNTCSVTCGTKKTTLNVVARPDVKPYLSSVTYKPTPKEYEPYLLARDDHGVYYYVDHGIKKATDRTYRVFVGKRGDMKQQKMKDVAVDSEGEVFSTATGDLRLVASHSAQKESDFQWVHGGKPEKLRRLPVEQNMTLIYTELGMYTGQRLGNPCDDF